ncbi:MAG: hypothetical protein JRD43_01055 [Deltaproteobacteria bacterium]|nr:hypothetical protein [Deltaproteobacteria bacterium]MBW2651412.1 hypothetical protein [Deltaproteobacteria bacterium]
MNRLGITQDRIAKRLGLPQKTISNHLAKMPVLANQPKAELHHHLLKMATLPNSINTDLSRGFTVPQIAEKHNYFLDQNDLVFDPEHPCRK